MLEMRSISGGQITVFKMMHEYEDFDKNMFFRLKTGNKEDITGHWQKNIVN